MRQQVLLPQSNNYIPPHPQCRRDYNGTPKQFNNPSVTITPFPAITYYISNLGVVERQSGSQAEHLVDWSQGEAVLLDSHWHGTGSGFGHWPRPELHYRKRERRHQRGVQTSPRLSQTPYRIV